MKAKAMKAKSVKPKRSSTTAVGVFARSTVFAGHKQKTVGGLTKGQLTKSKEGKIVSKKASAASKKNYAGSSAKAWADACKKARKELGLTGFVPVGGKSAKGKALYAKAKALYA